MASKNGSKPTLETREDLFCPECSNEGMRPLETKAESGRTRYRCVTCGFRTTTTLYTKPQLLPETKVSEIKKHKRFLITSAVNDTKLVMEAHKTFERIAKELDACYLVIPGVYKNPDLKHQGVIHGYTWPKEILPYICNADVALNKNLTIRGSTRIQYTAINPLSGMNHAGDIRSEIFGHPQIAMEMVATPKVSLPKMMHTTGSISVKNYGGSKRAKKAKSHHSIGAVFIEIEGSSFWHTEVGFDGEGAYLFNRYYTPKGSRKAGGSLGAVFGDIHVRNLTKQSKKGIDNIRKIFKPETEVYHDLHDQHIGSHHHVNDTIFHIGKSIAKEHSIRDELLMSVKFLEDKPNVVLVDSNHHRHLDQWFNRFKANRDPVNADLYFELGEMAREDFRKGGDANLFRLFIERYSKVPVTFVHGNDLFIIGEIDCSQHGDRGPNGARGSAKSFSKTGYKTIIAHVHTPGIEKGCWQVGTSTLNLNYAIGYSSWMITHCIIHKNGKRALVSIVNNKLSPILRELALTA